MTEINAISEKTRTTKGLLRPAGFGIAAGVATAVGVHEIQTSFDIARLISNEYTNYAPLITTLATTAYLYAKDIPKKIKTKDLDTLKRGEAVRVMLSGIAALSGAFYFRNFAQSLLDQEGLKNINARAQEGEQIVKLDIEKSSRLAQDMVKELFTPDYKSELLNKAIKFLEPKTDETQALRPIEAICRFAEQFYNNDVKMTEKYKTIESYYEQYFLPMFFGSIKSLKSDLFSTLAITWYAAYINNGRLNQHYDSSLEQKRILVGEFESAAASGNYDELSKLIDTTKFLLFGYPSPFGENWGAGMALVFAGETTTQMNDVEVTTIASSVLEWKNADLKIYRSLVKNYPKAMATAIDLKQKVTELAEQRDIVNITVDEYVNNNEIDEAFAQMMSDSESPMWRQVGMGVGIGDRSIFLDIEDITFYTTNVTPVWLEYWRNESDKKANPSEKIVANSFADARKYYVEMYKDDPKTAIRELIISGLNYEKMTQFLLQIDSSKTVSIKKSINEYTKLTEIAVEKRKLSNRMYGDIGPYEMDGRWEILSNAGIASWLQSHIKEFPDLAIYCAADPRWTTFCTLAGRESCYLSKLVKPYVIGADNPINPRGMLQVIHDISTAVQQQFMLTPDTLLNVVADIFANKEKSNVLRSYFFSDDEFQQFVNEKLNPTFEAIKYNDRSSIVLSLKMFREMTN